MNAWSRGAGLLLTAALALLLLPGGASAAPPGRTAPRTVEIATTPPMPGARFTLDGQPLVTDGRGTVRVEVPHSAAPHRIELVTPTVEAAGSTAEFVRWHGQADSDQGYTPVLDGVRIDHTLHLRVAFQVSRTVRFAFVDQAHHPVDPRRITSITLRSDSGRSQTLAPDAAVQLVAMRPSSGSGQLVARDATYSVQAVTIDGANVVNIGEQRFRPSQLDGPLPVVVLLRSAHFRVTDRLLGGPVATVVHLSYPDGRREDHPTDGNGEVVLEDLARGTYSVTAAGEAYSIDQQLTLSRSQFVDLPVLSHLDALILGATALLIALGLLWLARRRSRRHADRMPSAGDGRRTAPDAAEPDAVPPEVVESR
jgi:hypothetical protein